MRPLLCPGSATKKTIITIAVNIVIVLLLLLIIIIISILSISIIILILILSIINIISISIIISILLLSLMTNLDLRRRLLLLRVRPDPEAELSVDREGLSAVAVADAVAVVEAVLLDGQDPGMPEWEEETSALDNLECGGDDFEASHETCISLGGLFFFSFAPLRSKVRHPKVARDWLRVGPPGNPAAALHPTHLGS